VQRYSVQITRIAEADICKVFEYISRDNKSAAIRWVKEIERQIVTLENFPLSCQIIPEAQELRGKYRHLIYGNYRTIFRVEELYVIILRIMHSARLLDQQILEK